ncbi:transferase [Colletotrichum graminicola M1.001]|uniref:Transferase n=1 Tax=Colletotrichum graminicola (strain M1.001 / M2 / FGSC 10212) TaxID=645133 RepID=E3Q2C6_COLGM|nr:transferase [Colletotrichum graminicola M1.001]EFQ25227.1 transferase [Colletotrichum graminicola M1.001]
MPSTTKPPVEIQITKSERVFPQTPSRHEQVIPLSLLDATLTNFAHTNAVWLFEPLAGKDVPDMVEHLRQTLGTALSSYPQWAGQLKSIAVLDDALVPAEAKDFPVHARRFGRVYAHFGTAADVGVEFTSATSSATTNLLYRTERTEAQPLWDRKDDSFDMFVPPSDIAHALFPNEPDTETGLRKPVMAIQYTALSDGGFVLAVKTAHPLADITSLVRFVKDWASVSRTVVEGSTSLVLNPVFEPARLDNLAAGDISAEEPDSAIIRRAHSLPFHRYDWWATPGKPPAAFLDKAIPVSLASEPIPWDEWDLNAPISHYTIHLNKEQVDFLWKQATNGAEAHGPRISKHDAVLAHVWSCIMRARQLGTGKDDGPVYCDLALGVRSAFKLGEDFMGSPIVMMNVELPYSEVSCVGSGNAPGATVHIARKIRDTISRVNKVSSLADHLHNIAYEKSPQRIWQGFLGRRHIVVTTWARAGMYDVDFGLGSRIRFADSVVPNLDSSVVIKEAPPSSGGLLSGTQPSWTDSGVDISVHISTDAMARLLKDPLLLPRLN